MALALQLALPAKWHFAIASWSWLVQGIQKRFCIPWLVRAAGAAGGLAIVRHGVQCTQRGYYAWPRRFACAETRPESRPGTLQLWQFMAIGRPLQAPPWGRGALQSSLRQAAAAS